jgi:hypothetical protein
VAQIDDPQQKFLSGLSSGFFDQEGCMPQVLFVRAYNSFYGESEDSNPVNWWKGWGLHSLEPTAMGYKNEYLYYSTGYDPSKFHGETNFINSSWMENPSSSPLVGFDSWCDAPECHVSSFNAYVVFTLPDDIGMVNDAALYWNALNFDAYGWGTKPSDTGSGAILSEHDCWTTLSTVFEYGPAYHPFLPIQNGAPFGRNRSSNMGSDPIYEAIQSGNNTLTFWFTSVVNGYPDYWPITPNMDRCRYNLSDVLLQYVDFKP